uniref:Kelch domain-containing protein n=1 Tax=Amphimedon queenslandica TaxID=400682 RepID=A0A1X7T0D7_AMPQE
MGDSASGVFDSEWNRTRNSSTWERIYPPKEVEIHIPSTTNSRIDCPPLDYSEFISGRYAHSCIYYRGKLYMYGGRNDYRFFLNVDCFDIESRKWSVLKTPQDNVPLGLILQDLIGIWNKDNA